MKPFLEDGLTSIKHSGNPLSSELDTINLIQPPLKNVSLKRILTEAEMSELEKLRAENRILRAEKEHAQMEADFLKKLAEIERRRG